MQLIAYPYDRLSHIIPISGHFFELLAFIAKLFLFFSFEHSLELSLYFWYSRLSLAGGIERSGIF